MPGPLGRALRLAMVAALLASPVTAGGQDPVVFRSRVDLAAVNVSILAGDRPARGVTRDDVRVLEAGIERQISFVLRPEDAALDLAILLDASDSMARSNAPGHALELLDGLAPDDCVLFLPFADGIRERLWASPDDPSLRAAIARTRTDGATRLYDALVTAEAEMFLRTQDTATVAHFRPPRRLIDPFDAFRFRPVYGYLYRTAALEAPETGCRRPGATPRRRAIVAVTDGLETAGAVTAVDALRAVWAMETPVYILSVKRRGEFDTEARPLLDPRLWEEKWVALGPGLDIDPLLAILEHNLDIEQIATLLDHNLEAIAATSGGHVFWGRTYARAFHRALEWLRAYHVIGYRTEPTASPTDRSVSVEPVDARLRVEAADSGMARRPTVETAAAVALAAGLDRMSRGALEEAALDLARAESLDPKIGSLRLAQGLLALQQDRVQTAVEHLREAVALAPWLPGPDFLLANLYLRSGHHDAAWEHALHAWALGDDRRILDRLLEAGEPPPGVRERIDAPRLFLRGASMRRLDLDGAREAEPLLRLAAAALRADSHVTLTARPGLADAQLSLLIREVSADGDGHLDALLVLTEEEHEPLTAEVLATGRDTPTTVEDAVASAVASLTERFCARGSCR